MNSLIWLWLYSLVSAACKANYAIWSPGFGMTVINDLIPALPQVSVEDFENLNRGIDADNIGKGVQYKVPYSSRMTINKPAKWSGNCPKTLLLLGEETTQNTPTPSQQPILSTTFGATPDHTTTSVTGTHKAGDPSNSRSTGQATDTTRTNTPTAGKVESMTATGSAAGESAKPAMWICWPSGDSYGADTASKAIREKAVNDFCKRFKDKPLTQDNEQRQNDLVLVAKLEKECQSKVDEAVCLTYFKAVEKECSGHGGILQDGCAYVWIVKDSEQNKI